MVEPSRAAERHGQPARPRLEFPILEAFPRVAAEARAYPVTTGVIAICIVNFLLINLVQHQPGLILRGLLSPSAVDIWSGAFWGLATSAFVHVAWWHILFNVWLARDFGHLVEPDLGRRRYIGFVLGAAITSAGWELLTTSTTPVGLSGVVYALFGYTLARRRIAPHLSSVPPPEHDPLAARVAGVLHRDDNYGGLAHRQCGPHRWPDRRLPCRSGDRTPTTAQAVSSGIELPLDQRRCLVHLHAMVGNMAGAK